jgi:hypothetical protein
LAPAVVTAADWRHLAALVETGLRAAEASEAAQDDETEVCSPSADLIWDGLLGAD